MDNDYIKLFFDYKIKGSEWDNLYWRITVDLIEQKLCDVDDNLYKDFETMDSEERDKLTLEESIYSRIYDYVLINKENTIAKLSSYNGVNFRKFIVQFGNKLTLELNLEKLHVLKI